MSLTQTSDDSLGQIISFLTAQDVMHLMATGSKGFMARVARNTTRLFWRFSLPSYFPTCSYSFANLRSLTIKAEDRYAHLSLHGRTLLPLEPMPSLEYLDICFPTSQLVLAPPTSHEGKSLASSFPRLTSLAVQSKSDCPFPHGWTQSLPQGLLSLTMNIWAGSEDGSTITPSLFDELPAGLQHLEFSRICSTGAGKINLLRFADLRVLRLMDAQSWDALKSFPDSLEELSMRCWNQETPAETFSLSKLPPKIKVLSLIGCNLKLILDTKAPPTIEELTICLDDDLEPQELDNFFHTKNLRVLREMVTLTPASCTIVPNVTELTRLGGTATALDTFSTLPRKLESLVLSYRMRVSNSVSFKGLPPALKLLGCNILCANDISDLPKTITNLTLQTSFHNSELKIPAAAWRELPPLLRCLDVQTRLFESAECLQELPASLTKLELNMTPSDDMVQRLTFSKSLQESLENLCIYFSGPNLACMEKTMETLCPKLSPFSRLSSLRIAHKVLVKSSTLSYLPKSLIELHFESVEFENFGLPLGQERKTSDWKEGALSRLPEGLATLHLVFSKEASEILDFKLFSHLPTRLGTLYLYTKKIICDDPKSFVASLPRRISWLDYTYIEQEPEPGEESVPSAAEMEFKKAMDEYYSDPFWDGQRYHDNS